MKTSKKLVFLRFSSLGDVAISIPLIRCFLSKYPDISITYVTKDFFSPLLHEFRNVKILELDYNGRHKGFKGLFNLYMDIKELDPIGIVDLHSSLRTNILRMFFLFSSIRFKKIHKGRIEKKSLTRKKNKVLVPLTPVIHRYGDVLRKIGFPVDLSDHEFPSNSIHLKNLMILFQFKIKMDRNCPIRQTYRKNLPFRFDSKSNFLFTERKSGFSTRVRWG